MDLAQVLKVHHNECIIRSVDISGLMKDIFDQINKEIQGIKILKMEGCKIKNFDPEKLSSTIRYISLQQNNITDLDAIIFGENYEECNLSNI